MELRQENLLSCPKEASGNTETVENRAMQLFKIAEFLNAYFNDSYSEDVFQKRCLWCRVQLDQNFFDQLTLASECKESKQRTETMKKLHIYVEDFLIAYSENFFTHIDKDSQILIIHAADQLHHRMDRKKLEKFFHISGLLH
ncbi:MAG: hypothetical protein IJW72_02495 [Alphaproteobacteria bacterium]|nr:hypothetical protein [Alphaproteobacteria bacterium]